VVIGALAVFFGLAAFAPVFLCPEKRYIAHTKHLAKTRLLPNLMEARKNRPFLIVLSIKFFTFFCYSTVGLLGVYMNTYFVYGGDVKRAAGTYAVLGSSYAIAACTSFFIYPHIARLLGKKRALQCAAGLLVFGCICKLFVYQPKHPWLQLIVLMANGASVQGINFVIGTMMGDVIDYDELLSGKRREALYSSLVSWFESAGQSFGLLICGFLLVWIGFDAKIGAQHPHTLHLMRFFYFLCPFIGGLFAVFMISRYDLTEDRAYEIKDELNRRHTALTEVGGSSRPGSLRRPSPS
jgi:GPH family glycoside/pentoside/hexuronide:cation symporter